MIDAGGQKMPVTGSPGKSPKSPSFRAVKGEYVVEKRDRQKSPGKVQPSRGTELSTHGVRTISGGIDAFRQSSQIRGGMQVNESKVTRLETSTVMESSTKQVSRFEASPLGVSKSPIKKGPATGGRTTGVYKGGGIITKNISGTRGLNYL